MDYRKYILDVPDFPKPGIVFRDMGPLLATPRVFQAVLNEFEDCWRGNIDAIAALDARGFILGAPLAVQMGVPFAPIRKKGKLPGSVHQVSYGLEYGTDVVELQAAAFPPGTQVLIVDDVLATGGTAAAACALIEQIGCRVAGCAFLMDIGIGGYKALQHFELQTLVTYERLAA